jgi:hypothetical protein
MRTADAPQAARRMHPLQMARPLQLGWSANKDGSLRGQHALGEGNGALLMRALNVARTPVGAGWVGMKNLVLTPDLCLNGYGLAKACLPAFGPSLALVGQPSLGKVSLFVAPSVPYHTADVATTLRLSPVPRGDVDYPSCQVASVVGGCQRCRF